MVVSLPNSWRWSTLSEIHTGEKKTINPKEYPDELFEYYSIPAYQKGLRPLIEPGRNINSIKILLQPGTILFGKLNPRVEKVWKVEDHTSHRKIGSTEWLPIVPRSGIDPNFVYFLLWSEHVMILAKQRVSGSTPSRQRVDPSSFYEIRVPVPPLPEQRQISALLSAVQRAIEQQERLIALTTELKKALMHKLFTEGTRGEEQKMTEIGPVPKSWDVQELCQPVKQIDYGFSKAIPKTPPPRGVKIVSTADINRDGELLYDKIRTIDAPDKTVARLTLQDGDILFNWRNSLELIGKTTIYEDQPEPHIFASFILRIRCDEENSHNYYFKYLLNHYRERGVFVRLARRAVNQANYNKNEISVLKVPIPPYEEQVEIASHIRLSEEKLMYHKALRRAFSDLFRSLLHQLMTAQIRVNDIDLSELGYESVAEEQEEAV